MEYRQEYQKWLDSPVVDEETKKELRALEADDGEVKLRFYKTLDFGTAGLRGIMGAGLNMMNRYTVRYTTQGLADLIRACGEDACQRGVCIACDSRNHSMEFSWEAACTLVKNGIRVYIFDELRPTPELSFSVREHKAIAGINITASHNPKEYNGYKVYWEDGAQLPPDHAKKISQHLGKIDPFQDVLTCTKEEAEASGLVTLMGREIDELYIKNVLAQSVNQDVVHEMADSFKVIYTPFHGAGYRLIPDILKRLGITQVLTVKEQMTLDGDFPTVKSPNPEDKAGFAIAIEMAKRENIDLIIGTDPDADRCGTVVRRGDGEYVTLSGNQMGVLLLDYIIRGRREQGTLPANAAVIKSIVTTNMAKAVCEKNGVTLMDVLTGFKFIGEKIKEFEKTGEYTYLFGFEESYGYLAGTYARDKDAVVASMLIAEMACWYKKQGMSLYEAMEALYVTYGYYEERVVSVTMAGLDGIERMKALGERLRKTPPKEIGGLQITRIRDYLSGKVLDLTTGKAGVTGLPSSDVLFYEFADDSSLIVRPSGTEPKVKLYIMVKGESHEWCAKLLERLTDGGRLLLQ